MVIRVGHGVMGGCPNAEKSVHGVDGKDDSTVNDSVDGLCLSGVLVTRQHPLTGQPHSGAHTLP